MTGRHSSGEPIDDYLDDLLLNLRLPPRDTRRLLAETEDHLQEAAAFLRAQGMTPAEAEHEAVRRFGPTVEVASAAGAARRPSGMALLVQGALACLTLAGVGLTAVGISGALAALTNVIAGPHLVGALPRTYPASTCAYYLAAHPGTATCAQAAMWENSQDAVALRLLAGLFGVAVLFVAWAWRRASNGDRTTSALRDGVAAAFAAVAFGVAAAILVGTAVDLAVQHGSGGTGFYFTGGITAVVGAALSAHWSYRHLRHLRPWRLTHDPIPA